MMMEYKMEKETALVEAILYLEGEPLDDAAISKIAGLSVDVVKECIKNLKDSYSEGSSGIEIHVLQWKRCRLSPILSR